MAQVVFGCGDLRSAILKFALTTVHHVCSTCKLRCAWIDECGLPSGRAFIVLSHGDGSSTVQCGSCKNKAKTS